jgi:hypothetical protein
MRSVVGFLLVFAFVVISVSVAVASAPGKAVSNDVVASFSVSNEVENQATVTNVPPQTTGYDVICNRAEVKVQPVTTERQRQSTTGDVQNGATVSVERRAPEFVLLA